MFKLKSTFIAVLSDVHANLEALTAVLADITDLGISHIGFLGDAVGYGPDPLPCLNLLREKCDFMLVGNHDRAVAVGEGLQEMSVEARETALWTAGKISQADKHFLENLPFVVRVENCQFVHGSPLRPEKFDYILSVPQAKEVFLESSRKYIFTGHSHIPAVFIEMEFKRMFAGRNHRVVEKSVSELKVDSARRYLLNVGSVGQPRDGDCRAAYGVFDMETGAFELRRIAYDIKSVVDKMRREGFSEKLTERLLKGL
jgi:diadenosine tetraphosphatase ApaH/serine/threonine PP2A family protein phosphatase